MKLLGIEGHILRIGSLIVLLAANGFAQSTQLNDVRLGAHREFTRLVFDAEGERPVGIENPAKGTTMVRFGFLRTNLPMKVLRGKAGSVVQSVEITRKGKEGSVSIHHTADSTLGQPTFIPGDLPEGNRYRLILDFSQSVPAEPGGNKKINELSSGDAAPEGPILDHEPSGASEAGGNDPPAGSASKSAKPVLDEKKISKRPDEPVHQLSRESGELINKGDELLKAGRYAEAMEAYNAGLIGDPDEDGRLRARYGLAEAFYALNEANLSEAASTVVDYYSQALRTGEMPGRTQTAIFRAARCSMVMGDPKRALKFYKQLTKEYPRDTLAGRAWLSIAAIHMGADNHLEAMKAAHSALSGSLLIEEKADAHYYMGKGLAIMGESRGAKENLDKCLAILPTAYKIHPDLLRYLGESQFALGDFAGCRDNLLHYVNLVDEVPDRDLIMARISESLSSTGDEVLAERLRSHIENLYPDSDGAVISSLRKAEEYETANPAKPQKALAIYEDLLEREISPQLRGLVELRLANWKRRNGDFQESMQIVDRAMSSKVVGIPREDFAYLKEKLMVDLYRKAYEEKSHREVIRVYEENPLIVDRERSAELMLMQAESYGVLKRYPEAIEGYERALALGPESQALITKIGEYSFLLGDYPKAAQYFQRVKEDGPSHQKNKYLGRIYSSMGKHAEAVEQFSRILKNEAVAARDDMEWLPTYVDSLARVGKAADSVKWAAKALAMTGDDEVELKAKLYLIKIGCLQELKKDEEVVKALEEALALPIDNDIKWRLSYQLATLYAHAGKEDKAMERFAQIAESGDPLWKSAAKQQLDYLQMKKKGVFNF